MRARIIKRGNLAYIETELGQRAVVPWDALCNFLVRFNINVREVEGGELPKCMTPQTTISEEVSLEVEPLEESDEDQG
ncbi:hypothetical protein DDW02_00895 [Acidilobus sp. SCGC AC-742_M05]|nr:MAG: hypothetical protein OSP8Acid_11780 [uncultured Acidilobus sp. OSP8]MDT7866947.1 hypothetical protein [Acidianus sp.]PVU68589.1 hypothetical protein DDW02_00895 [Acidilobus sp. SCGC AC-742_M05]PVU73854.1 hypothetical protein DDW07_01015 [Acidilobus sp. SCGC AC-742_E15]